MKKKSKLTKADKKYMKKWRREQDEAHGPRDPWRLFKMIFRV